MRSGAGDPHPDFLLVNQGRFLTGQMDDWLEKQWAPSRIFPQAETNKCCGNVEMFLEDAWGVNPFGKDDFQWSLLAKTVAHIAALDRSD